MENKINIAEILKDCPKGTKLYSPIFGNVSFEKLIDNVVYPIHVVGKDSRQIYFSEYGLYIADDSCSDAECQLFPSREVRDWNKFFKSGDVLVHWHHGLGVIFKEWIDAYISFKVSICQLKSGDLQKETKMSLCLRILARQVTNNVTSSLLTWRSTSVASTIPKPCK